MLIQVVAGVLLLAGSALIFFALVQIDRVERPVARPMARPARRDHELPRAA